MKAVKTAEYGWETRWAPPWRHVDIRDENAVTGAETRCVQQACVSNSLTHTLHPVRERDEVQSAIWTIMHAYAHLVLPEFAVSTNCLYSHLLKVTIPIVTYIHGKNLDL